MKTLQAQASSHVPKSKLRFSLSWFLYSTTVGSDQTFDRDNMCLIASLGLLAVPYGRCVNLSPIMLTVARDIMQLVDCTKLPELADGKVITLVANLRTAPG